MASARFAVLCCAAMLAARCGSPLGPSCAGKSGPAASLSGAVGAGQTAVHRMAYDAEGSQNDLDLSWTGQGQVNGPRLEFYVTRVSCEDFSPASPFGPCEILARAGWSNGVVVSTLIVTHGRGNPERLGAPPEYKLWVVGDPQQGASYSLTATWRRPVEC